MSDPTLFEIAFKNKMAWIWTTLNRFKRPENAIAHHLVTEFYQLKSFYNQYNPSFNLSRQRVLFYAV